MLIHYIKIALRNLRKYPTQTAVSVLGLAAGFVCLSLSALWMRYENTYDTMHKDYERIYTFQCPNFMREAPILRDLLHITVTGLSGDVLKDNFPEIEALTSIGFSYENIRVDGMLAKPLQVSKDVTEVFEFPLLAGDYGFTHLKDEIAITENFAHKLFPAEDSIVGRMVTCSDRELRIGAVLQSFGTHSIFQYDVLSCNDFPGDYGSCQWIDFVKLYEESSPDSLIARLPRIKDKYGTATGTKVIPLNEARILGSPEVSMKQAHLGVFFLCSLLLTVCALISYLVTFLIRLRAYGRNIALRIVNGATTWQLLAMLMTEFLIVLLIASAFGMLFIEWLHVPFVRFTGIGEDLPFVLRHTLLYMVAAVAACMIVSIVPIAIVRRQALQQNLTSRQHSDVFRKVGVFIQLVISITFIYCTVVMTQQVKLLKQDDWGMRTEGSCTLRIISIYDETAKAEIKFDHSSRPKSGNNIIHEAKEGIASHISKLPMVEELLTNNMALIGDMPFYMFGIEVATERDGERRNISYRMLLDPCSPYYGLKAVEGAIPHSDSMGYNDVIISESLRDELGLTEGAVGKSIYWFDSEWIDVCNVVAVVKDIHIPGARGPECMRSKAVLKSGFRHNYMCIAFVPSMRQEFAAAVDNIMATHYPNIQYKVEYTEDYYNETMRSENNLMQLLLVITAISIFVAMFGVYSIVTLACVQRRKEIAIRKAHGATRYDILLIFIKEYGLLVLLAAITAFIIGYLIMSHWLMQYPNRIIVGAWVYIAILAGMTTIISACVGIRVWRTARENPAEVVKSGS